MNDDRDENAKPPASAFPAATTVFVPSASQPGGASAHSPNGNFQPAPAAAVPQFTAGDAWIFIESLARNWGKLTCFGLLLAGAAFAAGFALWKPSYTASAQLIRRETPGITEVIGERELAGETFSDLLHAPELLQRVGMQHNPPLSGEALADRLKVNAAWNSDIIVLNATAKTPEEAIRLANLYAADAVTFTRERQADSAAQVSAFVSKQLEPLDAEIAEINALARASSHPLPPLAAKSTPLIEKLASARLELADLEARFTEKHPAVREQRAKIAAIESQLAQATAAMHPQGASASLDGSGGKSAAIDTDPVYLRSKLTSLESARLTLATRKQAAETLEANPPGYCELLAQATQKTVEAHKPTFKVILLAAFAGMFGVLLTAMLVMTRELVDHRLKTAADVARVTNLPVLATAGDLSRMNPAELKNWAFRAWTKLQGRLSPSPNHGFVCGITSSGNGEGRSTWVNLLTEAASARGFRVLTIATRPPATNGHAANGNAANNHANGAKHPSAPPADPPPNNPAAIATNALATPAEVSAQLTGPDAKPMVHIPLPGWVWNLERRKQWQSALRHWSQIDNVAIFVELPPASLPETVLLAENLPNLIWLADAGKADANQTREQLDTLRHARCKLAGAVLNHAPGSFLKKHFPRWLGCIALMTSLAALPATADEAVSTADAISNETAVVTNTNRSFSVVSPMQRADWQKRLTLGPGDVLNISLYGEPLLTRLDVVIGPDGYVAFAEGQPVLATGLTIDELRDKLNQELGKYRRAPQVMISPVAFRSKRYFILGKVMTKGVYVLDRPITVLEAVARAHGFENGLIDRNIVDMADFSRSFIMRGGKRIPLNFEKLYQDGDLSQNIAIEPGDYIYFPTANTKEVYVVGEVRLPGTVAFTPNLTIMGAIASRAGFSERAWKSRVLVIRGSLNQPERFAVDTMDIVKGKETDFRLQPKDIIYVSARPFIKVEELSELALQAFVQSIVAATVTEHLLKPYQDPE